MGTRLLTTVYFVCSSVIAAGQITGRFYLDKTTFAKGEPVFLYFQVTNDGREVEDFDSKGGPYHCNSSYRIMVSNDPPDTQSCSQIIGGSCLEAYTPVHLRPGESYTERLLLNFEHEIASPGDYSVEAAHYGRNTEVHSPLAFRVDQNIPLDVKTYQPWLDGLHSHNSDERIEAARTLASVAPRSLEGTLLSFAANPEFREFAPLAFHRLNTSRSMEALADLMKTTQPGTFEHLESASYLADSGDQKWLPLLLGIAIKNVGNFNYVADAAELGGDKTLPVLLQLAGKPDQEFRSRSREEGFAENAVAGMGYTGSRKAVPILLRFLNSPDTAIAEGARRGLQILTHRVASDRWWEGSPKADYSKWLRWWSREGASAPIYRSTECGDFNPIKELGM